MARAANIGAFSGPRLPTGQAIKELLRMAGHTLTIQASGVAVGMLECEHRSAEFSGSVQALQLLAGGHSMPRTLRLAAATAAFGVLLTGVTAVAPADFAAGVLRKTSARTCSTFVCRTTKCRGVAASRGLCFNWCGLCKRP